MPKAIQPAAQPDETDETDEVIETNDEAIETFVVVRGRVDDWVVGDVITNADLSDAQIDRLLDLGAIAVAD